MSLMWISPVMFAIAFAVLHGKGACYRQLVGEYGSNLRLGPFIPGAFFVAETLKAQERWPAYFALCRRRISALYGSENSGMMTKLFLAELLASAFLMLFLAQIAASMSGDGMLYVISSFVALLTPVLLDRELERKWRKRNRSIMISLPEYVNKLALLMNAGETLHAAVLRSADEFATQEGHPLHKELKQLSVDLRNRYPFARAIEQFGKRCAVQEVSVLCSAILMNYRRGGSDFVEMLREISRSLWDKRKAEARTIGEEASAKLVFPMVVIFIVIMIVVSFPALMYM